MNKLQIQAQQELDALKVELTKDGFRDGGLAERLAKLRTIARTPHNAPSVYSEGGISVLAEGAFGLGHTQRPSSSLECAKILANALLLQDQWQQVFAHLNHTTSLLDFYSQSSADHEFVGGRLLFLLTYKSKVDFIALIESQQLLDHVRAHLSNHLSLITTNSFSDSPMKSMALTETLKLLYNLASKYSGKMSCFSKVIDALIGIVSHVSLPSQPLEPPISQLLNALAVIEWPTSIGREPGDALLNFTRRLFELLDRSTSSLGPAQLETQIIPLITVLRKLYELGIAEPNDLLRLKLLPQDDERDKPLGQSQTLASRLLKLQTSGGLTILPEAISGLLFDLSDRDATKFVHNIGYGHAAGYLMTHKIPIPQELAQEGTINRSGGGHVQINPVTGQRLDAEIPVDMPAMSDEEKEREAQRLFVLFERLKATGVMNVENPMKAAQQSGRFEELSDSEPD